MELIGLAGLLNHYHPGQYTEFLGLAEDLAARGRGDDPDGEKLAERVESWLKSRRAGNTDDEST